MEKKQLYGLATWMIYLKGSGLKVILTKLWWSFIGKEGPMSIV